MDPLSITVSVATLVVMTGQAIQLAHRFVRDVRHARKDASSLIAELEILKSCLENLGVTLMERQLALTDTSVLVSTVGACKTRLTDICKKLGDDKRMNRFLWPFTKDEHEASVQGLRVFAMWIQLALTIEGSMLMTRTSHDVLEILGAQLGTFQSIGNMTSQIESIGEAVRDQSKKQDSDRYAQARFENLNWFSTFDHEKRHRTISSQRTRDTGNWFLEDPTFSAWKNGTNDHNTLWCHGIPGSGKSVISSLVIDHLKHRLIPDRVALTFLYFDFRDKDNQTPSLVIRNILRQLGEAKTDSLPLAMQNFKRLRDGSKQLQSAEELEKLLVSTALEFERVYIVLDALDECDGRNHRKAILDVLSSLHAIANIRIFVTSRDYPTDILRVFSDSPQIRIEAHRIDLERYILQKLQDDPDSGEIDDEFATEIVEKICASAEKMFILPVLQIKSVLDEPTLQQKEDALAGLPSSLFSAFESTIQRIQALPGSRSELGLTALMWISCAKRPLTMIELREALAIRRQESVVNIKNKPSQAVLLESCQGLVGIDETSSTVRLVHKTVQDYLEGPGSVHLNSPDDQLAASCISYLLYEPFQQLGVVETANQLSARLLEFPLLAYCAEFWGHHFHNAVQGSALDDFAILLLNNKNASAVAVQVAYYAKGYRKEYWDKAEAESTTALHTACRFGLTKFISRLTSDGRTQLNCTTVQGTTPLMQAAAKGHALLVRDLLNQGADPTICNWYGNALHCASEAGESDTIVELIKHGLDPNIRRFGVVGETPLMCTLDKDESHAAETLLNLGANPHARDFVGRTTLHIAAAENCVEVAEVLLRRDNASVHAVCAALGPASGFTALHFAAYHRNGKIWDMLISAGANTLAVDAHGHIPQKYRDDNLQVLNSSGFHDEGGPSAAAPSAPPESTSVLGEDRSKACVECRQKQTSCNTQKPICSQCLLNKRHCTYTGIDIPTTAPLRSHGSSRGYGRIRTGCIMCRKRKTKCDKAKPGCLNCQGRQFKCCYRLNDQDETQSRDD